MPVNPDSESCFEDEMSLFKKGQLHSGRGKGGRKGPVVTSAKQARAIAASTCNQSSYSDRLQSLGLNPQYADKVGAMLPNWKNQFEANDTLSGLPRENKTTIAPTLAGLDIDNRPGKQPGNQGRVGQKEPLSISPGYLPRGNPQQGPRSRSDLKGFRLF